METEGGRAKRWGEEEECAISLLDALCNNLQKQEIGITAAQEVLKPSEDADSDPSASSSTDQALDGEPNGTAIAQDGPARREHGSPGEAALPAHADGEPVLQQRLLCISRWRYLNRNAFFFLSCGGSKPTGRSSFTTTGGKLHRTHLSCTLLLLVSYRAPTLDSELEGKLSNATKELWRLR